MAEIIPIEPNKIMLDGEYVFLILFRHFICAETFFLEKNMNALSMFETLLDNKWMQIAIAIILLASTTLILFSVNKKGGNYSTKSIVYGAVCVALASVLNLFKFKTGVLMGGISGSITMLRMLPIVLYATVFGAGKGVIVGVAYGLVDMLFGLDASGGVVQVILDYIVAFGLIGLSGLAKNTKQPYIFGTLIATVGRFIASFISGAVFFGMYAPEGMNIWAYSAVYQCVTVVPDMLLVLIAFAIVQNTNSFKQIVKSMRGEVDTNS